MGTTSEKLTYLNTTKTKIKEAINITGANITNETFRAYETKLKNSLVDIWTNGGDVIWNNWNKTSGSGESITLNNTIQAKMKLDLLGNTSQSGTPTPESPQPISVVSGNNTITISNDDNTQSQTYPINLPVKNFFNYNDVVLNSSQAQVQTITKINGVITLTATGTLGAQYAQIYISGFDASKSYTLSFKAKKTVAGSGSGNVLRIKPYGSNDGTNYTGLTNIGMSSPTTNTEYSFNGTVTGYTYYRFYLYNDGSTPVTLGEQTQYYDIQFEEGTKANRYTNYGETPIELCKIGDYKDSIFYNTTDTNLDLNSWYIKKEIDKVVLDGSEDYTTWGASSTNTNSFKLSSVSNMIINSNSYNKGFLICNYFKEDTNNALYANDNTGIATLSGNLYFRIEKTLANSVTNFKTWLSTHNTTVYYRLNTPTYTKITDTTLIQQLEAIKLSYANQTNISQVNNDKPFIINASAMM